MKAPKEKILIIDDEAEILDNCRRILERAGFDCMLLQESENFVRVLSPVSMHFHGTADREKAFSKKKHKNIAFHRTI
ncbi:MAG: hypothetical protein B6240_11485 [Desulfobacteraceae bacterium 4572_87]|nr:MAG: hypothetical protein B6240_11485 [Desulfobacteraceae bacterium 4572_87]